MSGGSQNDLKDFFIDQYEDWIYPNRKVLGVLILLVVVILAVLFVVSRSNANFRATAWEQYFKMLDSPDPVKPLEELATIKDGFFEHQSAVMAGQLLLTQACNMGFTDKSRAAEDIEKALTLFQNVRDSRNADNKFKRQAALGAAQAHEAMAAVRAGSNDLDSAIAEYKKVVEKWQGKYEAKVAEKQLALLSQSSTKKFYDRYATASVDPDPDDFKIEINKDSPLTPNTNSPLLDDIFKDSTTEKPIEKSVDTPKND
ncbi:MAG: hypothetical protein LBL39_06520 [Planctomycetaceae bacterium]|jgi:hypothetical protein|nr:hypothetical protein [Planctomycetaceae bacterium]